MSRWITPVEGRDPEGIGGVQVNASQAVLVDGWTTLVAHLDEEEGVFALALQGKLNRQTTRSDVLYLMSGESAADLVAEIVTTFARNGQGEEFLRTVQRAITAGKKET